MEDYKSKYEELLKKYEDLQNKYDALRDIYQNEMAINSMASYQPLQTEPKPSGRVPNQYNGYSEWKDGNQIEFDIFS